MSKLKRQVALFNSRGYRTELVLRQTAERLRREGLVTKRGPNSYEWIAAAGQSMCWRNVTGHEGYTGLQLLPGAG